MIEQENGTLSRILLNGHPASGNEDMTKIWWEPVEEYTAIGLWPGYILTYQSASGGTVY
mgnify:CR=1 FL=1